MLEKARAANNPDELLALAAEAGVDLSREQAERAFENLNGDLTDEELADVSNAGCCEGHCDCIVYCAGDTCEDFMIV